MTLIKYLNCCCFLCSGSSQLKAAAVCLQASLAKCKAVLYDSSTLLCDFFNRSLKHDLQQAGTSTTLIYIEITTGAIQNNTNVSFISISLSLCSTLLSPSVHGQ